jgi:hypothetical protein
MTNDNTSPPQQISLFISNDVSLTEALKNWLSNLWQGGTGSFWSYTEETSESDISSYHGLL